MTREDKFWQVCLAVVIVVMLALVAGQLLGQPVLLSYVETESMSPTLEPGDGFVPIPTQIAGPIEEDAVITFEAKELHGGGLTTHRVVDETDRGYITRGDGNPFTDQDGDEPPVKEPQIVATALEINGQLVVIPEFGTAVEGIQSVVETTQRQVAAALGIRSLIGSQGFALSFFAATLLWYAIGERRDDQTAQADRDRSRETGVDTRLIVAVCALLLVLTATAAMVAPSGTQECPGRDRLLPTIRRRTSVSRRASVAGDPESVRHPSVDTDHRYRRAARGSVLFARPQDCGNRSTSDPHAEP